MVYVSNGQVLDSRAQSPWRLSLLVDLFWGAVEFIGLFFKTMFHPDMSKNGSSVSSRFTDGRG
uniref:Selenoprotein K n=4 Tax=Pseudocrenilabrinae TaxID=318546 RepID=A0A669E0X7_ORENI